MMWLKSAGLIHQVRLCREPRLPLKAYDDLAVFKVYANDIGLLRRLAGMTPDVYMQSADLFKEFKGALAENYILQSFLYRLSDDFRYWTSGNKAEIEFLLQNGTAIIPVEVKSGTSLSGKSLTQYNNTYAPPLRLRFSMQNLKRDNNLVNLPLFMADRTKELINLTTI